MGKWKTSLQIIAKPQGKSSRNGYYDFLHMVFVNCQVGFIGMCSGHWSTAMCDHPLQMGQ
jgi:hypothetical protein